MLPRRAKKRKVIGVISDTHGLIRPEALRALQGADLVIHAGDIGKPEVKGLSLDAEIVELNTLKVD